MRFILGAALVIPLLVGPGCNDTVSDRVPIEPQADPEPIDPGDEPVAEPRPPSPPQRTDRAAPEDSIAGKVSALDLEKGLVIVSVGSLEGVEAGDEFVIHRGDEFIAKGVIEKIVKTWSGGKILESASPPREGDTVKITR